MAKLTEQEQQEIIRFMEAGKPLQDKYRFLLFEDKAIESWFLADTEAMRSWTGDNDFHEPEPESKEGMPWERLKQIGRDIWRGPVNSKPGFTKKFIYKNGFDVRRAGSHPNCPSARYFVEKLYALGKT